jgi:hypothetical protein
VIDAAKATFLVAPKNSEAQRYGHR